jgi:hypothetical protein
MKLALLIATLLLCVGCTDRTSKLPNPAADKHADKLRAMCSAAPGIVIEPNANLRSASIRLPAYEGISPDMELLRRRLTFLETYTVPRSLAATPTKSIITRYFFAEFDSTSCAEFRKTAVRYPSSLIPMRQLGLPESLCIAHEVVDEALSEVYFHGAFVEKPAVSGHDWERTTFIRKRSDDSLLASVRTFGYCDLPMCWHGFACHRDDEEKRIWELIVGTPDPRLLAPPELVELPATDFQTRKTIYLKLESSTELDRRDVLDQRGGRSGRTHESGLVYLTEASEAGYNLEIIGAGKRKRVRVRVEGAEIDDPRALEVQTTGIYFVARVRGEPSQRLYERILVFSSAGEPVVLATPRYAGLTLSSQYHYTVESISMSNGRFSVQVLEDRDRKDPQGKLLRHRFEEL